VTLPVLHHARTQLDHTLSLGLLPALAAARRRRDTADAHIRLLLAYALVFETPQQRPSLNQLARISGKSRSTLRAGRAYTPGDLTRLTVLLGRPPHRQTGGMTWMT
jgi:hypothetical protein